MSNIPSLNDFARDVNQLAHDKGWYEGTRPVCNQLFLVNSELAEAGEEFRAGHALNLVYEGAGGKPEGFPVEIADALIRLLDAAVEAKADVDAILNRMDFFPFEDPPSLLGRLLDLQYEVCLLTHQWYINLEDEGEVVWDLETGEFLAEAVDSLFDVARVAGFDLLEVARRKHAYNATRPHRHGGKLA